jgi:hypothetical protein
MKDAIFTAKELKLVAKSGQRERMPTKGELTALCRFLGYLHTPQG